MKKETKRELIWIIVMILFLLIFFLTGCKNYYIITPSRMEMVEIRNRFEKQFEEADSVFNSMLEIDEEQINRSVKASVEKLKMIKNK